MSYRFVTIKVYYKLNMTHVYFEHNPISIPEDVAGTLEAPVRVLN